MPIEEFGIFDGNATQSRVRLVSTITPNFIDKVFILVPVTTNEYKYMAKTITPYIEVIISFLSITGHGDLYIQIYDGWVSQSNYRDIKITEVTGFPSLLTLAEIGGGFTVDYFSDKIPLRGEIFIIRFRMQTTASYVGMNVRNVS